MTDNEIPLIAIPAPIPTSEDSLHRVLALTEELGLPEGHYLTVCNALKKAFNTINAPEDPHKRIRTTSSETELAIRFTDCITDCELTSFVKTVTMSDSTLKEILFDVTITYLNQDVPRNPTHMQCDKLKTYMSLLKPATVCIIADGVEIVYSLKKWAKIYHEREELFNDLNFGEDHDDIFMTEYPQFTIHIHDTFLDTIDSWGQRKYFAEIRASPHIEHRSMQHRA